MEIRINISLKIRICISVNICRHLESSSLGGSGVHIRDICLISDYHKTKIRIISLDNAYDQDHVMLLIDLLLKPNNNVNDTSSHAHPH